MKELDDITGAIVDVVLKDGLHRIVNNLPTSASPRLSVNQPQS